MAFKSLPGDGVIITIAGANGLENQTPTPLPTASTYHSYCEGSAGVGAPPGSDLMKRLLRSFRIFVQLSAKPDWGIGRVRSASGPWVTVRFANRGIIVVDTRSAQLSIVRIKPLGAT